MRIHCDRLENVILYPLFWLNAFIYEEDVVYLTQIDH